MHGIAPERQALDPAHTVPDVVGGVEGAPDEVSIAVDAEVRYDRPGGGHREARPGPLQVRRCVEAAQPLVEHERLVAAELPRGVEQHRHPLRRVAQLVDVGRDGGDPLCPEVPRGGGATLHLGERQHEPAHAGIDVAAGSHRCGQCGDLRDGVDQSGRIVHGRGHDQGGVRPDHGCHRVGVGGEVGGDRGAAHGQPEQVGALVEGGVGGLGQHDLGFGHATLGECPLPCGLDGEEDALGAAAGEEAGGLGPVEQAGDPTAQLRLDGTQGRECRRVEGALVEVEVGGGVGHGPDIVTAVEHQPEGAALCPAGIP